MRIDNLCALSGSFVARVSAAVTTVDPRPGRGDFVPAVDTAFASIFAVPSEGGTVSVEAPAATTAVAQHAPSPTNTRQRTHSSAITDPAASTASLPGDPAPPIALPPSGRTSTRTNQRTGVASSAAPPAVDYDFGPDGAPRPSERRANTRP